MPDLRGNVSRETRGRLETFEVLLGKWNPRINLVAAATLEEFWTRHIADSAQLLDHAPADARFWADLGSGGGFPGMVIAITAAERLPELHVTCVESDQRKAAFLRTVSRETDVPMTIHAARIEAVPPLGADVVSARALAPLDRLLGLAVPHVGTGGVCLFPKGANAAREIAEAQKNWRFRAQSLKSETDDNAAILRLEDIVRA